MSQIIERLIAAHQVLNREIRRELARRAPASGEQRPALIRSCRGQDRPDARFRLTRLKKERLAIKDRLFRHFPDAAEMRRVARMALRRVRTA